MSLLIWLPLHGNLTNYGTLPVNFTLVSGGGLSAASSGGKTDAACYSRTTANSASYIASDVGVTLNGDFSMACWCYATTPGAQTSANGILTNHNHEDSSGAGITLRYESATDCRISCNTGNGTNRTFRDYYGTTNIYGAWHHLCLTYDKSATKYKLYVDGICEKEFSYGNSAKNNKFNLFDWSTGYSSNAAYRPICKLNDVRVYDTCLSTKEIKLLSQGLVAHYKLNGNGANNLLINSSNLQTTTGLAHVPSTCTIVYDNVLHLNVLQSSTTATTEACIYSARTPVISKSTQYTFSCDLWVNDYVKNIDFFWLSDTEATQKTGSGYVNVTSTSPTISKRNEWMHLSWTFTTKADDRTGYIRIDNNGSSTSGTAAILKVSNLKLEKGSIDTGYSPAATESFSSIGDDCSGYCHHGTPGGIIVLDTDSPRYQTCTVFDGSTNGIILPIKGLMQSVLKDKCTINFWVNEGNTSSRSVYFGGYSGSNFNIEMTGGKLRVYWGGSPDVYTDSSSDIVNNQWAMFTVVVNIATGIKIYKNGTEIKSWSGALSNLADGFTNENFYIGRDSRTGDTMMEGKMSDFRIYCTELSADDILSLYKTAGSVTKLGGLIAYEFQESSVDNAKIQKRGIFNAQDFSEKDKIAGMALTMLADGSSWARIHWLNVTEDKTWFASNDEVASCNEPNRFSRMGLVDQFKTSDGVYEFMLTYPSLSTFLYNRWTQTSSPNSGTVTGFTPITTAWSGHNGGIRKNGSSCVYNCDTGSTWFAPIGQKSAWDSTRFIPAADGSSQTETELWVRIDTLPSVTKFNIMKEHFVSSSLFQEI